MGSDLLNALQEVHICYAPYVEPFEFYDAFVWLQKKKKNLNWNLAKMKLAKSQFINNH